MWNKNKPSWPDNSDITNEWPQPNKLSNASSEIIRSSKQFRLLVESGFKKDDAEIALRTTNMNVDEAMEILQQQQRNNSGIEPWHHSAAGGAFDHSPFQGNRYPAPQMPQFPPNNPKLPNSGGVGPNANLGGLNNLPMQLNKHLPHQAGTPAFTQQAAAASQSGAGGQPSAHHLRNLVQQIQKAVQAGYLNHQILNQPLAPQTLQLLNSLLNTIQQLQYTQQSIQRNGGVNSIQLQMTIQKQKQQISQLQSQIAQQQSLYIKSQAAGSGGGGIGGGNEFLRQNSANNMGMGGHSDPINSLENNLAGLGLKPEPNPYPTNTTSQQSRLNQWKLPSALDNKSGDPVDFSRAPGTTSKQSLPPTTPTSISSIGIHSEAGPWSTGRNDAGGWPDSTMESANKDWPTSNQSPAFTDLVPEFQPGKPWKVKFDPVICCATL
jgi:trinucleotide repeat-containing gene 6 protein